MPTPFDLFVRFINNTDRFPVDFVIQREGAVRFFVSALERALDQSKPNRRSHSLWHEDTIRYHTDIAMAAKAKGIAFGPLQTAWLEDIFSQ